MLKQLRQRNVHRAALAYLAAAWLLIQIVETLTPDILPAFVFQTTVAILAIGFLPAMILAWVFEWTPDGIRRESNLSETASPPESRRFDRLIIVTLVMAVAYFAVDKFVVDPVRDSEEIEAATAAAVEDALAGRLLEKYADRSIIVLPFVNMSADAEQEYFADGIAEELLNLLARIDELRVISRSTSFTFKGKAIDVANVRDRLNVSHILEGSVRKAGNRVRITAQLIDARTDQHLWSETYDRNLDDIFAVQDEISLEVVQALKLELLAGAPAANEIDPFAYDLYLKGRHLTHTVRTPEAFDEAVEVLSRSTKLAPDYVPAISELARAISNTDYGDTDTEVAAKNRQVRDLVDRLIELAPDSSYANSWLAWFAEQNGEMQEAALYLERAIGGGTDSGIYLTLSFTARFLGNLGRLDEATALGRYVIDRDPACSPCVNTMAYVHRKAGHHRKAAESLEALLNWRDGHPLIYWHLGVSWLVAGEPAKALEYFELAPPGNREMGLMLARHDLGELDAFSAEFEARRNDPQAHPEGIARIAAWTGQDDLAFENLGIAIEREGPGFLADIRRGADLYAPIVDDPRWQALFERHGMAEDESLNIRFNPKLPTEVQEALAAAR